MKRDLPDRGWEELRAEDVDAPESAGHAALAHHEADLERSNDAGNEKELQ